jgi:hypothetical protein
LEIVLEVAHRAECTTSSEMPKPDGYSRRRFVARRWLSDFDKMP